MNFVTCLTLFVFVFVCVFIYFPFVRIPLHAISPQPIHIATSSGLVAPTFDTKNVVSPAAYRGRRPVVQDAALHPPCVLGRAPLTARLPKHVLCPGCELRLMETQF